MRAAFTKICQLLTPAQRRSALVLLGLMLIGLMLEILGIGLVIPVSALMMQDNIGARYPAISPILEWLGKPGQHSLIVGAMLGLTGIYLIKNLFLAFLSWREVRFAFDVQAKLSQRLFATYLRQPYTFHLQRNSAQLIHNATDEVSMFAHQAITPAMLGLTESLTLLAIASFVLMIDPLGVTVVALVLGIAAWGFHRITRARIVHWGEAYQHHEGLRMQHLMQGLGSAKDVKLFGREREFLAQFHVHNIQSARMEQLKQVLQRFPLLWLELLTVVGLTTLVLTMLAQGRDAASIVPAVGFCTAAAFRLMPSVNRILGAVQSLRFALPAIDILHEELKLAVSEPLAQSERTAFGFHQEIRLINVSFAYPDAPVPALKGVSLNVQRGESVGLIGPSGAGKSTLVDVILGLLTPTDGQVRMDGKNIQELLRCWQDQIGYVPQSIFLTDDTLRRNVAFGLPDEQIDNAAVCKAIKAAQLDEFVAGQAKGLETLVGERGIRLSGGQRQRIGIARALYHNPAVLVLDEASSSLDAEAERSVMEAVTKLQGSKTLLIVAHRLTTVEHCNRIYLLDQGKIAAEGEPATMIGARALVASTK